MKRILVLALAFLLISVVPVVSVGEEKVLENEWDKMNRLCDLFDKQLDLLDERGCPDFIIDNLWSQRFKVVETACNMSIRRGNIEFIPVIPESCLSFYRQMEMVVVNNCTGTVSIDPSNIKDLVRTPKDPYFVFDVNDGWDNRGMPPDLAEKMIKNMINRSALTTEEIISLGIHTNILERRHLDALNSRIAEDKFPSIVVKEGRPILDWCFLKVPSPKCGVPYCRREKY